MRAAIASLLLALSLISTGCTDVLTYANKSREEGLRLYSERAYADAAGAFRNAIRQDPRDYRSQFYLGVCYDDLKQHHQAFSQYRISLDVMTQVGPNYYEPQFRQKVLDAYGASVARNDENESESNAIMKRAQGGSSGEEWFILAKAFRIRGDADRAIDAYTRAARVAGDDFFIKREFGLYLLDPLAQNKEAEYWLRQANRLQPHDEDVNTGLAKLGVTVTAWGRGREPMGRITPPPRQAVIPAAQPTVAAPITGSAADLPRD
ncbi:MAG TPA: tetratricopeptide repeat protein [Tepidisphaeraceae bacterium]|nr:tetratricopeptide repeat protein [Tepidisphaeraceae bacterium]